MSKESAKNNKMNDVSVTMAQWDKMFDPVLNDDGAPEQFETWASEINRAEKEALKYAKSPEEAYKHIWTAVDGEGRFYHYENGWHSCNRLFYVVSKNPWEPNTLYTVLDDDWDEPECDEVA